jgi:hypothetical protein
MVNPAGAGYIQLEVLQSMWMWCNHKRVSEIVHILFLSRNYDYLNICSSAKYFFKDRVSSPEDSESRPNGFSTINLVHPLEEDAVRLADLTTSTNMFGGMDR